MHGFLLICLPHKVERQIRPLRVFPVLHLPLCGLELLHQQIGKGLAALLAAHGKRGTDPRKFNFDRRKFM